MKIHRVKHTTIPVSAFKPAAANGHRRKVLRWFEQEHLKHPHDCLLRVENECDGSFELWADFASTFLNVPEGVATTIATGSESLAQSIVNKIEVAPISNLTRDCNFVIFQESPQMRELCQHQDQ